MSFESSSDFASKLTFVVPTKDRPELLYRLLYFMKQTKTPNPVRIVDSSDPSRHQDNLLLVDRFSQALDISYSFRTENFIRKCYIGLQSVTTPFVAFCADDDFAFWKNHALLVEVLEKEPAFAAAQGQVLEVSNSGQRHHNVFACRPTPIHDVVDQHPVDRMATYTKHPYATFYCVQRSSYARHAFELTDRATDFDAARGFPEALLLLQTVIAGKLKTTSDVHYMQVSDGTNCTYTVPRICDPSRTKEFIDKFCDTIAAELCRVCELDLNSARKIAESYLYLVPGLRRRRPGAKRSVAEKIKYETAKAIQKSVRQSKRLLKSPSQPVIRNRNVVPHGTEYELALQLLANYPQGIRVCESQIKHVA